MANSMTFEDWMARVEDELDRQAGVSANDIVDWKYYLAWSEGCTVKRAATLALEYSGFFV